MANGDITKTTEYDKIEVVDTWGIQVRQATILWEEQVDGSKKELTRTFHRYVLEPGMLNDSDELVDTDLSSQPAEVAAICNAVWTSDVKAAWKAKLIANKSNP